MSCMAHWQLPECDMEKLHHHVNILSLILLKYNIILLITYEVTVDSYYNSTFQSNSYY